MIIGCGIGIWPAARGGGGASWVLSAGGVRADLDIDFLRNRAWVAGAETTALAAVSCTRSTAAYYRDRAGLLTSVATNTLRIGDMGALIEGARTNVVLHNRDLTNVAWTKTDCTAAKNQTGPDGVTNSASSLTATAANATCLQAITLASSARFQSAFVKRMTGSGVIKMTTDNGSTWVDILPRADWDQLYIPTQTLANPTVGFRIVTSGDAIAVDFVQNENGESGPTSPIATTTVAASRGADLVRPANLSWVSGTAQTLYTAVAGVACSNSEPAAAFQLSNGASAFWFQRKGATQRAALARDAAAATQWSFNRANAFSRRQRNVFVDAATLNDISSTDEIAATFDTDNSATVPSTTQVSLGSQETAQHLGGYLHRFAAWASRISNVSMQSVARSGGDFILIVEGDSIPLSPTTIEFTGFAGYWERISNQKFIGQDAAVPGSTVVNVVDAVSLSGARLTALNALRTAYTVANPGKRVVTLVHIGHNDLAGNGHDAAAFTTQLATYLDTLKSNGHTTLVCTVPPSTSNVAFNPARATANTTIRGWLGGRVDYLCDWDLTAMGADAAAADTTFYSDGIHPTTLGAIILAEFLKTVTDPIAA